MGEGSIGMKEEKTVGLVLVKKAFEEDKKPKLSFDTTFSICLNLTQK